MNTYPMISAYLPIPQEQDIAIHSMRVSRAASVAFDIYSADASTTSGKGNSMLTDASVGTVSCSVLCVESSLKTKCDAMKNAAEIRYAPSCKRFDQTKRQNG